MSSAPGGRVTWRTGFDDAIALDQDFARRNHIAGFDFEQARGVENDGVRGRLGTQDGCDEEKQRHGRRSIFRHIERQEYHFGDRWARVIQS